ncbi:MAG: DUF5317 domain-containing protein [Bacillota bacterium]|nr:DUF5317 domain-containing protein [Bacillota bacterium]
MIETVLLAIFAGKIKGYKLKPIFKDWVIYPVMIFTLFYVFLQITIFCGYYGFIKYAGLFEKIYIFTFLPLIIKYGLYKSALTGSVCIYIGTALNKLVMAANKGRMPVFPSLSYITGYAKPESFLKVKDIHILGSNAVKLKFLTDYIDLGYSILSIGDIFIRLFTFIMIFSSIKYINKKIENREEN